MTCTQEHLHSLRLGVYGRRSSHKRLHTSHSDSCIVCIVRRNQSVSGAVSHVMTDGRPLGLTRGCFRRMLRGLAPVCCCRGTALQSRLHLVPPWQSASTAPCRAAQQRLPPCCRAAAGLHAHGMLCQHVDVPCDPLLEYVCAVDRGIHVRRLLPAVRFGIGIIGEESGLDDSTQSGHCHGSLRLEATHKLAWPVKSLLSSAMVPRDARSTPCSPASLMNACACAAACH